MACITWLVGWAAAISPAAAGAAVALATALPPAPVPAAPPPTATVAVLVDEFGDDILPEKKAMYDAIINGIERGCDARVEVLSFDRKRENITPRLTEAKNLNPDAVVALGSNALKIVLKARTTFSCPITFSGVLHPEVYVREYADVCGVSLNVDARHQLEVLRQNIEGISRVGIVYASGSSDAQVELARSTAKRQGIEVVAEGVRGLDEALKAVDRLEDADVDVFLLLPDALISQDAVFHRMRQASVRHDIPIISPSAAHLRDDAILSFEVDYERCGLDTAALLNRLFGGEKPQEVGIVHQRDPIMGLNSKIARAMRITIPPRLRKLADHEIR